MVEKIASSYNNRISETKLSLWRRPAAAMGRNLSR